MKPEKSKDKSKEAKPIVPQKSTFTPPTPSVNKSFMNFKMNPRHGTINRGRR